MDNVPRRIPLTTELAARRDLAEGTCPRLYLVHVGRLGEALQRAGKRIGPETVRSRLMALASRGLARAPSVVSLRRLGEQDLERLDVLRLRHEAQ